MDKKEPIKWITVNGNHVPVYDKAADVKTHDLKDGDTLVFQGGLESEIEVIKDAKKYTTFKAKRNRQQYRLNKETGEIQSSPYWNVVKDMYIKIGDNAVKVQDKKGTEKPKDFETHAEEYVGGGVDVDKAFSKEDLDFIKNHQEETSKPLYRVEDAKFTAEKLYGGDLDDGDFEFNGSFRSFSRDFDVVGRILDEDSDEYAGIKNPAIFKIVGKKKHFDMEPYTKEYHKFFESQSESFVGGRFAYVGETMEKINGKFYPVIEIEQRR